MIFGIIDRSRYYGEFVEVMPQETARDELARLKGMLQAREGKTGYQTNVQAIKARIEELERIAASKGD